MPARACARDKCSRGSIRRTSACRRKRRRAQVAAAQNEYDFAKAEYGRYQNLLEQKFVSASALDAKRNAMNTNAREARAGEGNLSVTRNQAAYATLVAPEDGVITAVTAESGQVVAPAQVVMRHARETEREVAIAVPEARINELERAAKSPSSLVAEPDKPYRAQVREISPVVDPATRTFAVRVKVADPAPALQWGMTANVVVAAAGATSASLLPATSVYHTIDGRPAVWVFDPTAGKVALRPVVIAPIPRGRRRDRLRPVRRRVGRGDRREQAA